MASINTNPSSFASLQNLNSINRTSSVTQNRVSTGLNISSALDSASNFAIGQGLQGELRANSAISQGINNSRGIANVGLAGLNGLSDLNQDIQAKLTSLGNEGNTAEQTEILQNDLNALLDQAENFIENSSFNGRNQLESGAQDVDVLVNDGGGTQTISGQGDVADRLADLRTAIGGGVSGADALNVIENEFAAYDEAVSTAQGSLGASSRSLAQQDEFLQSIQDATAEGLGNTVDADLGREAANLQAQQVQQQLSVLTTNIANQQPQTLLGLFR